MKTLKINDTIKLHDGYDFNPVFLQNPPNKDRIGKVIKSIPVKNQESAFIVKLDFPITAKNTTGDILVMKLRYQGQTWKTNGPVHLELCDFVPEDKQWKDRKHGVWIESHASFDIIENHCTSNKRCYAASTALAFVLAIFSGILFADSFYPINLVFSLLYLVLLFSPSGKIFFRKSTNYIRVLTVATVAIIASAMVGLIAPMNIGDYYDKKGALGPDIWLGILAVCSFFGSVIVGLIFAYIIFKKYYKKQENEEKI
jgi:hypothetical protein